VNGGPFTGASGNLPLTDEKTPMGSVPVRSGVETERGSGTAVHTAFVWASTGRLTFDTHQTAHAPAKVAPTDGGYGGHLPEVTPESVPHAWSRIVKGQVVENEKVTGSSVQNRTGGPAA